MADRKVILNEYLFYEFGLDLEHEDPPLSATWPFELSLVGIVDGTEVYEFVDDEPYYALDGELVSFLPQAEMTLADLELQSRGARWIGSRDPLDLATSMIGTPDIPPTLERRKQIALLAKRLAPAGATSILEGLYLRSERRYLALVSGLATGEAVMVGAPNMVLPVGFPKASNWRRLAWAVARWLEDGRGRSAG